MGSSNNDNNKIVEPLKKKPSIEDVRILDVRSKYRLHLTRYFRELMPVEIGERIIVAKEAESHCPYCKKKFKLPGFRLFIVKKEEIAVIIESADNPVHGTQINLS